MKSEHDKTQIDAYEKLLEQKIPKGASFISSQVVFKIKIISYGTLKLKGRIFIQGNREYDNDKVKSNKTAANMKIVTTSVSLYAILGFKMKTADIKGAQMQSRPITREFYVLPLRYCYRKLVVVWKLLIIPYGKTDDRGQWILRFED